MQNYISYNTAPGFFAIFDICSSVDSSLTPLWRFRLFSRYSTANFLTFEDKSGTTVTSGRQNSSQCSRCLSQCMSRNTQNSQYMYFVAWKSITWHEIRSWNTWNARSVYFVSVLSGWGIWYAAGTITGIYDLRWLQPDAVGSSPVGSSRARLLPAVHEIH